MTTYKRPELGDVKVDDDLLVLPGRYFGSSPDPVPVRVTKAARVWLTMVPTDGQRHPREYRMRRDTQDDGGSTNYNTRFATPEQYAYDQRVSEAWQFLKNQGISFDFDSPWRGRELEFVTLTRALLTEAAS